MLWYNNNKIKELQYLLSGKCFPEAEANSQGFPRLQLGAAERAGTCKGGGTHGEYGITAADGFVGRR